MTQFETEDAASAQTGHSDPERRETVSRRAYRKLEKKFEESALLRHLQDIASWDQSVFMPHGAIGIRSKAQGVASELILRRLMEPETGELLAEALNNEDHLSPLEKVNLRLMKLHVERATAVDPVLTRRLVEKASQTDLVWRQAREKNDWPLFLPHFKELMGLVRESLKQISHVKNLSILDTALDSFQPGLRESLVDRIFVELKQELPLLLEEVTRQQKAVVRPPQGVHFSIEHQRDMNLKVMEVLGFDFNRGRLDASTHPFCGGGGQDTRVTTRYDESDFIGSLLSTIHETGHACYEQGLPATWSLQPLGEAAGMAIHESQSLFYEMQVARDAGFLEYLLPMLKEQFFHSFPNPEFWSLDNFVRLQQWVARGFIRVEADEVSYPLHVILRYEIERAFLGGEIKAEDVPHLWNEKMQQYLGLSTQGRDDLGCLQDIHWAVGMVGYFPSYTLGAIFAAQLFSVFAEREPDARQNFTRGDFSKMHAFLSESVWSKGSALEFEELVISATGRPLGASDFLTHLKRRYLPLR